MRTKQSLSPEQDEVDTTAVYRAEADGEDFDDTASSTVGASAVAGGVAGLLVGGPVVGVAVAGAAAYAATTEGPAGDLARASGDVAVTAGKKINEVEEKHHFVDKTKEAAKNAWETVKEYDEKNGTVGAIKKFASDTWAKAVKFENEHHLVENSLIGIGNALNKLAGKIRGSNEDDTWSSSKAQENNNAK